MCESSFITLPNDSDLMGTDAILHCSEHGFIDRLFRIDLMASYNPRIVANTLESRWNFHLQEVKDKQEEFPVHLL